MCVDPVSLAIIGTGISAAGTVAGGISQASTAKANAAALQQQAAYREQKAQYDMEQSDRRFARQQGTTLARIGSSGVSATSFLDVLTDDAAEHALEKESIKFGATVDSNNLKTQASNVRAQGQSALIGSIFSAAGTLAAGYGKTQMYAAKGASGYGSSEDF